MNTDQALHALIKAQNPHWVHNAAITQDIEALRKIALYHAKWWNEEAFPIIVALCGDEATAMSLLHTAQRAGGAA
jgi:hypothetical protein